MNDVKEIKVPDIQPSFMKVNLTFLDENWKPIEVDLRVEDTDTRNDFETDKNGKVEIKFKGNSVKVLLFGKSKTETS